MKHKNSHLSDQDLLLDLDGELSARDARWVLAHTSECWRCRTRRQELENAIVDFVHVYQRDFDTEIPPIAGPRALLKARLAQLSSTEPKGHLNWLQFHNKYVWATALCGLLALGLFAARSMIERHRPLRMRTEIVYIPDSRLTPGAAVLVSRRAVCSQAHANNKTVPAALQRRVFEEYGILGADPRAYEVDYLVTPALGGADDIHNLWPHSYSATAWNARVKDALEDRLREMVCDGTLDLSEAQREIAGNWIGAYKKYFHTDRPLAEHWR